MKIKSGSHIYEDLKVYARVIEITENTARIEFGVVSEDGTELEIATRTLRKDDILTLDNMLVAVNINL